MTRADFMAEARTWEKTPWVHQAAVKGAGADCLHFVAGVARNVGYALADKFFATPEWHSYGRHPDPAMMFQGCDELMDRIPIATAEPGDVLVFRCGKHPMHFGIMLDGGEMIHSYLTAGRVVRHQLDAKWRGRIVRAYRLRGIE